MGIYRIVTNSRGATSRLVLDPLVDAVRALKSDPMWTASGDHLSEAMTRFRDAALADEPYQRGDSIAAVVEAQLAAGLRDDAAKTVASAAAVADLPILRCCTALAKAGLQKEAFALALECTTDLHSGVAAAIALVEMFPDAHAEIVESIRRTCGELTAGPESGWPSSRITNQ